jgi:sortase A
MWWSGMGLCALGLIIGAEVPYFYWHSRFEGEQLIKQAEKVVSGQQNQTSAQSENQIVSSFPLLPVVNGYTQTLPSLTPDSVLGLVSIAALHLTAPLLEGTTDNVLNVGVGHFERSANPGMPGTCVIAAHNATWFRHLDKLRPGEDIVLQTKNAKYDYRVTGARVAEVGDDVQNTAKPTIVLEACYPLNALYLTSKRYLVYGVLVSAKTKNNESNLPLPNMTQYTAHVPEDILKQGVTLLSNRLPMGSLTFEGNPDIMYTESNAPLSAVYTILQLYLSYVHASGDRNLSDLNQLLQSMADAKKSAAWLNSQLLADPFLGVKAEDISYTSKFDISLHVTGNVLTFADAATVVNVPKGHYQMEMKFSIKDHAFSILSIEIHKTNM